LPKLVLKFVFLTQGYVHNDIKAQNLLLGFGKGKENDVFLVDFGLATKYLKPVGHLEFKPDPKKAHDGTIEYTSRDAHIGTHSRRSDLEILAYNLVNSLTIPHLIIVKLIRNAPYSEGLKCVVVGIDANPPY
jgi:serine/threonine protein kinase